MNRGVGSTEEDRQKEETYRKLAYSAGTKHPERAMTVNRPTCLRYVLFPDMLRWQWHSESAYGSQGNRDLDELGALDDLEGRGVITIDVIGNERSCGLQRF